MTRLADLLGDDEELVDELVGRLRVGVQSHSAVAGTSHTVTQVYSSAVSVSYSNATGNVWEPMARLILRGTYEATLLVAMLEVLESASTPTVFWTKVGRGVFRNPDKWIIDAMDYALRQQPGDLDVRVVHFDEVEPGYHRMTANQGH